MSAANLPPVTSASETVGIVERLTYLIQFYVYAEAEQSDVQSIIDSLAERDSFTAQSGWLVVPEDEIDAKEPLIEQQAATIAELREERDALQDALAVMHNERAAALAKVTP